MRVAAAMTAGMLAMACLASCERTAKVAPQRVEKPALPAWQEALTGEVHAMADGSAYLIAANGVFYIVEGKIVEVLGVPAALQGELTKISALADGSALLIYEYADPPQAFWLKKGSAEAIAKVDQLPTTSAGPAPQAASFYFAQLSELRQQLANVDECEDPNDAYDDEREVDYE